MHEAVLADEVLAHLAIRKGGTYIDGTVGSGGHAERILNALGNSGMLLGIDRDDEALERSGKRLARFGAMCVLVRAGFDEIEKIAGLRSGGQVDGVILDLGVSSEQLESPGRGFSFMADGPLDMRMDRRSNLTAEDLVNGSDERELKRMILELGEDRNAGRIAGAIVKERRVSRIVSTARLASIVESVCGRRGRIHPATRTFQALRMAVNDEIGMLERGVEGGMRVLRRGGRMAVISFHSLEDRLVKNAFLAHAGEWSSLQAGGRQIEMAEPAMRLVTGRVVKPSDAETAANPRARSARLRVAERI